jgi:o-succinylbenzoate synthase
VTAGENPFYNEEWTGSAWLILRDYAIPRVLGRELASAEDVAPLTAHIRGHKMARGGLEAAVWDLEARRGQPLWKAIGGGARREIPCGVSIGIQDSVEQLLEKIERELAAGYQRIKMKIKPGWDVDVSGRCARALSRDQADGRREFRLHAGRRRPSEASSTSST